MVSAAVRVKKSITSCKSIGIAIKGRANANQIGQKDLPKLRGTAVREKLAHPEKFTIEQLIQLGIALDIPPAELLGGVKW